MFKQTLRELRREQRLTQTDLANIIGTSKSAVGNWELGLREPDFETLQRLADYFHVTTDYLLGRDAPTDGGQKEKPVDDDGLSEDERTILELLRQVPDDALPAARRALTAILDALKDKQ